MIQPEVAMENSQLLPLGQALLAFESHCIPKGYAATDAILKSYKSKLIEASPILPGRLLTLINLDETDLEKARQLAQTLLKKDLFRITKVQETKAQTIEAFYGLRKYEMKDCLIVAKSESTVDLIKLTNDILVENGVDVFDIRSNRGLGEAAILYATIDDQQTLLAESLLEGLELLDNFTIISDLSGDLKALFEISP